ncbi:MAG: GGDEF domain-containing protein [Phycisphaerales bacterium]|nr:GGDEF domain-containing protein [Phycisphaerales bacterium]
MTATATTNAQIRVLALGRSNAARTLALDPRAEVFAAADELTAIGELGTLAPAPGKPTLVLVSERARRIESLPQTLEVLRSLEPDARFVAVMEGRQRIDAIPGIDAWVHADDSADTLISAARHPAAPTRTQTPPPRNGTPAAQAKAEPPAPAAAPQVEAAPRVEKDPPEPRRTNPTPPADIKGSPSGEAAILEALTHARDPMPALLEHISAKLGAGSLRFISASDAPQPPDCKPGEHRSAVASADHQHGWLVGPACIAQTLDREANTLALWLTTRAQLTQLRHEAYTDPLTGAWNRRYFERFTNSLFQNASSLRRPVTILLFDIDDFKRYNDAYGHEAGDDILRETVRLLNSTVRADDRVCRIGGDEFAVIFNEPTGPRDASSHHPTSIHDIASRFRKLLRDCRFRHVGEQMQGKLTISGGLATYPWDGTTLEDLVRHADRLILESKRQGKNVICYGSGCALPPNDSGDAPAIPQ